jgi:hypothetical protein
VVLPDGALGAVELVLRRVIAEALPSGAVAEMGVLLAIDGIDAMMAATGAEAADVLDLVAELREVSELLPPGLYDLLYGIYISGDLTVGRNGLLIRHHSMSMRWLSPYLQICPFSK